VCIDSPHAAVAAAADYVVEKWKQMHGSQADIKIGAGVATHSGNPVEQERVEVQVSAQERAAHQLAPQTVDKAVARELQCAAPNTRKTTAHNREGKRALLADSACSCAPRSGFEEDGVIYIGGALSPKLLEHTRMAVDGCCDVLALRLQQLGLAYATDPYHHLFIHCSNIWMP
jgi:hypothetical protein